MSTPAPVTTTEPIASRRFYRKKGFWLSVLGLGLLFGLVLLVGVYWLLQTVSGRDWALGQAQAQLPAGSTLVWGQAEGTLAGPLSLEEVDFELDGIGFRAQRVHVDVSLRDLFARRVRVKTLQLQQGELDLPKGEETPFELPTWPEVLPNIALPIDVLLDEVVVEGLRVRQDQAPVIVINKLEGEAALVHGGLRTQGLVADTDMGFFKVEGEYLPGKNYRTQLTASALMAAPKNRTPARLGLVVQGSLDKMEVALAGNAPEPLKATVVLEGKRSPVWQALVEAQGVDLALLIPPQADGKPAIEGEPWKVHLQVEGKGGKAELQGDVVQGDVAVVLDVSQVQVEKQVLTVSPLVVRAFEGSAQLEGVADFNDPSNPIFDFVLNAAGLTFANTPDAATPDVKVVPIVVGGEMSLKGKMEAWLADGKFTILRDKEQAAVQLQGRGDAESFEIGKLEAKTPTGTLNVTGQAAWSPLLRWDVGVNLAGFDPGYFMPGWDGNITGKLSSTGVERALKANGTGDGYDATVNIVDLGGQLRNRAVDGRGQFGLRGEQGQGELNLKLGSSNMVVKGSVGSRLDVVAQLQPLHLDDVLPGGAGSMQGELQVRGTLDAPDITADLVGSSLRWEGWEAGQLTVKGALPWRGEGGDLSVEGSKLSVGTVIDRLQLQLQGAVENMRLQGQAQSELGRMALQGQVRQQGKQWLGGLDSLQLTPSQGAAWRLQQPAQFAVHGESFTLSESCFVSTGHTGSICAQANWPREGMTIHSDPLPLSLVQPWMPLNEGRKVNLRGELVVEGYLKPQGKGVEGKFHVASADGGVSLGGNTRRELLRYDNFSIDVTLTPEKIVGYVGTGLKGDGYIDATVTTGWDEYSPLEGNIYTSISKLFWLELFSPDLVRPQGLVEGHVTLGGTRGTPELGGEAVLSNFTGEFPAMGLNLTEGEGRFEAQPDGSAKLFGKVKSGDGYLTVDGGLSWFGETTPLQLNIGGENVLVSDTPQLRAVANPNIQFTMQGTTMVLRGQVVIPSADIDVERLDQGTSSSEDVVVLDPVEPEDEVGSPLDMDLAIVLGDAVNLSGFGLKGNISGQMQIRARPEHEMTATGGLEIGGRYKAYGQDLTITKGQLTWSNSVISDPRVNLSAERKIAAVTAGIKLTGRVGAPNLEVWSDPVMSRSQALGYLVVGRSLETTSNDQAQQVSAASAALSAGGGYLAAQLGSKIGLDDAGVSQSRALGGAVMGVGKYITPKLYVGYGVSLVGSGSVLTLKYLLQKGFDVELESSTVENRGSINWRKER